MAAIRVYIDDHCVGCTRAEELVERARKVRPNADVSAVHIANETDIPESLFALPTWYVDQDVWMLGNPTWDELEALIFQWP
jgi:hypothetical protein